MKKSEGLGIVYFRYIFPLVAIIIMIILMFVPCYRFVTADTGINASISLAELMGNSWNTVRSHLFSGDAKQSEATVDFSKYVLTLIIVLGSLFILGVVSVVYAAFRGFSCLLGRKDHRARALFITLIPNRIALLVYHALLLPIFLFPTILPAIYRGILTYQVQIEYAPFDVLYLALAVYLMVVFIVAFTARYEALAEVDVFYRPRPLKGFAKTEQGSDDADDEELDEYEKMDKLAREEQTDRILRMLNMTHQTQEKDEEDK